MRLTDILMNWLYSVKELFRRHFLREVPEEREGVIYFFSGSSQPLDFQSFQTLIRRYLRFSYRYNMPSLNPNSRGSSEHNASLCEDEEVDADADAGWGCMHRSVQSLLAHALTLEQHSAALIETAAVAVAAGGAPTSTSTATAARQQCVHAALVYKFRDSGDDSAPYSMHAMMKIGKEEAHGGQGPAFTPGKWIGPAAAAHLLKALVLREQRLRPRQAKLKPDLTDGDMSSHLIVVVATDMSVCTQSVESECQRQSRGQRRMRRGEEDCEVCESGLLEWAGPLLLLVPLQLGIQSVHAEFYPLLQKTLCGRNSLGLLGGRPGHALYVVGMCTGGGGGGSGSGSISGSSSMSARMGFAASADGSGAGGDEGATVTTAASVIAGSDCSLIGLDPHLPSACSTYMDYFPPHPHPHPQPLQDLDGRCCASGGSNAACSSISTRLFNELHGSDMELVRVSDVDPSMAMAFYFPTRDDFAKWAAARAEENLIANANAKALSQKAPQLLFDINYQGTSRFCIPSSPSPSCSSLQSLRVPMSHSEQQLRHFASVDQVAGTATDHGEVKIGIGKRHDHNAGDGYDDDDDDDDDDEDDFVLI